ncbi:MAG: glycosyltransferase [Oligoflexia bacterium]|nr:glycosyltransferase [Oligoflexia bacterium]
MHIVLYHDALIPPPKYGGTERIVYWLAKALLQLGHQVTLIARPGSAIEGATVIALENGDSVPGGWEALIPADADIVHLWGTPATPPKKPFLVTIQGNGRPGERFHPNTVFISRKHAENHGATHFVYNGIDPDEYPCDPAGSRENALVFLAKASWKVKNLVGAIEIARAANRPLYVMGSRDWPKGLHRFLPAFGGIRYLGMVGDAEKRSYLRKASALLFPVRWPEPFGIAITEALASGCAVFGTPYGSLPEIVTPDVGALSHEASVLLERLMNGNYSPETCRKRVFQGFTHIAMAESYLKLYRNVLDRGSLGENPKTPQPEARFQESAETLLPWKGLRS